MSAVIYACSHRKGGNTDRAADMIAQGVRQAGGKADIIHLREYDVQPCLACGYCDKQTKIEGQKRCVLGEKDQAWDLFLPLMSAKAVFFTVPIYFYHLPSRFKTLIDRAQMFWTARHNNEPWLAMAPPRTAHTVLVAGRPKGERLFEGAELTLKYFASNFNLTLAEPLRYRGIDAPGDFDAETGFNFEVTAMSRQAWSDAR